MSIICWIFLLFTAAIIRSPQGSAQIPVACLSESSLQGKTCCPNECGQDQGRGLCMDIDLPANYDEDSRDVRYNWPHYFTRACSCTGNYAGVDCSRCKYGYYGSACSQKEVLPRKSLQDFSDEEWTDYINTLKMTRTHDSGYGVVVGEYPPGTSAADMKMVNLSLYNLLVWRHHYAVKDSQCIGKS